MIWKITISPHHFLRSPLHPPTPTMVFPGNRPDSSWDILKLRRRPRVRSVDRVLLHKPTVHHAACCNRRRVVTSQAERAICARWGPGDIFVAASAAGQRAQEKWQHAQLTRGEEEGGRIGRKTILMCQDEVVWNVLHGYQSKCVSLSPRTS